MRCCDVRHVASYAATFALLMRCCDVRHVASYAATFALLMRCWLRAETLFRPYNASPAHVNEKNYLLETCAPSR